MFDSYSVLKVVPFLDSVVQQANEYDKENEPNTGSNTIGRILKDTKHIWSYNGPHINVINCKTGNKVASWCFGHSTKDVSARIVCIDEIQYTSVTLPLLIIGLQTDIGGTVCVFDIYGSRVLRTILIKKQVTSVHVVDSISGTCDAFENFDGILAVGTEGGEVLIVDLNLQGCEEALRWPDQDGEHPWQLFHLPIKSISSIDLLEQRQFGFKNGGHICTHLNAYDDVSPHFILKGPKGENRVHVNKVEVTVSSLYYCVQLGVLFVGYNFGAWQMWDLINLKLLYTSPVFDDNIPVAHFALQEPSDDPRAFCYMWVVYTSTESQPVGYPVAVLYSLSYEKKKIYDNRIIYQNFSSCTVRFQFELTLPDEDILNSSRHGAHCLGLQSINTTITVGGSLHEKQEENISICCLTWNGWSTILNSTKTYLSLFDLNQWYKAQMPSTYMLGESETYMSQVCLSDILHENISESILNVQININSLKHFIGSQRLEEHYYPASLAFQMCALTKSNIVSINNHGAQRALLVHLETGGALAIVKPTNFYKCVTDLGLLPLFVDMPLDLATTFEYQRDILLSVALEQKLLGWLCRCAIEWTNGSYSSTGCTLNFLLNWGWQRAEVLKKNADSFCVTLFDYSGFKLDANTHNMLSNCACQLRNLATLFDHIIKKCFSSELNIEIIQIQKESLEMAAIHVDVLLWLLNVGLLPECPLSSYPYVDELNRLSVPYDIGDLSRYYNERRIKLQRLTKEQISLSNSSLFIDNFINLECGGSKLQEQWQIDGGTGLYPPPSLQALLRTYLIQNIDITTKHRVLIYLFLDVITTLDQREYRHVIANLLKFPVIFHIPPSVIKITQGFWKLDHGDFSSALELLLDPMVYSGDFKLWQHRLVLKTLLSQEQYYLGLSYYQVRRPPLSDIDDICIVLSLFIANNMIDEAFRFQRHKKYDPTYNKILQHFFKECDQRGAISFVLRLPLTTEEQQIFNKYLHIVKHPKLEDFKIFNHLEMDHINSHKDGEIRWKEVEKPKPLSVLVHSSQQQIKYKSTTIHAKLTSPKEVAVQTPRLICPRILEEQLDDGPSPCKRFKLSPRLCASTVELQSEEKINTSLHLHTPVVKRKLPKQSALFNKSEDYGSSRTPQSILKVRTTIYSPSVTSSRQQCKTPENLDDILFDKADYSGFHLSARKTASCTPKPVVHFDISKTSSEASLVSNSSRPTQTKEYPIIEPELKDSNSSFKKGFRSSDDFYSTPARNINQIYEISSSNITEKVPNEPDDVENVEHVPDVQTVKELPSLLKSRKSYRASLSNISVRSSPRLRNKSLNKASEESLTTESSSKHSIAENLLVNSAIEDEPSQLVDVLKNTPSKHLVKRDQLQSSRTESPLSYNVFHDESPSSIKTPVSKRPPTPIRKSTRVSGRIGISTISEEANRLLPQKLFSKEASPPLEMCTVREIKSLSPVYALHDLNSIVKDNQYSNEMKILHKSPLKQTETSKTLKPETSPSSRISFPRDSIHSNKSIVVSNISQSSINESPELEETFSKLHSPSQLLGNNRIIPQIILSTTQSIVQVENPIPEKGAIEISSDGFEKQLQENSKGYSPKMDEIANKSPSSLNNDILLDEPSTEPSQCQKSTNEKVSNLYDQHIQGEIFQSESLITNISMLKSLEESKKSSTSKQCEIPLKEKESSEQILNLYDKCIQRRSSQCELPVANISKLKSVDESKKSSTLKQCKIPLKDKESSEQISNLFIQHVQEENTSQNEMTIVKENNGLNTPITTDQSEMCRKQSEVSENVKKYMKSVSDLCKQQLKLVQGDTCWHQNELDIDMLKSAYQSEISKKVSNIKECEISASVQESSKEVSDIHIRDEISVSQISNVNTTNLSMLKSINQSIRNKEQQGSVLDQSKLNRNITDQLQKYNYSKTVIHETSSLREPLSLQNSLSSLPLGDKNAQQTLIIEDLNTAHLEFSVEQSISNQSSLQVDESVNTLNANILENSLVNLEDETGIEIIPIESKQTIEVTSIQDKVDLEYTSSSVNMTPTDLELNIFEVHDDLSKLNTEHSQSEMQKIELDSNYNGSDDEYAKNVALFSQVLDSSNSSSGIDCLESINEHNENIQEYSTNEIGKSVQTNDGLEIIEIESSSDEQDSIAPTISLKSEEHESELDEKNSSNEGILDIALDTIPEEPSSLELEGLCIAEDVDSQPANQQVEEEKQDNESVDATGLTKDQMNKGFISDESSQLSQIKHTKANVAKSKIHANATKSEIIYDPNSSKDIMDYSIEADEKNAESFMLDPLDASANETVMKFNTNSVVLKNLNKSATSEVVQKTKQKKARSTVNDSKKVVNTAHIKESRSVQDIQHTPVSTHSSRKLDITPSFKRDILDITVPVTPFTSDINRDELEKTEYMNRSSLGMTFSDTFDKPQMDDEESNTAKAKPPLRRSRRLSSSNSSKPDILTHSTKSKPKKAQQINVEECPVVPAKKRRSKSIDVTPKIELEEVQNSEIGKKKSKSIVVTDTYSASRRLTRRQASLIEKSFDRSVCEIPNRGPDIDAMDPIKLLDKTNFEGIPDPDEEELMQKSPSSSISGSVVSISAPRILRSRSSSLASKTSACSETPVKNKNLTDNTSNAVLVKSSRLHHRSKSVDETMLGSPPKLRKTKAKSKEVVSNDGDNGIAHRTRSKSVIDQPVGKSRTRGKSKLKLSKISEEQQQD